MKAWWLRSWPWAVCFLWLIGYEIAALITQAGSDPGWPTLSQIATRASLVWWPLPLVSIALILVLVVHFWGGKWWRAFRERL